MEDDSSYKAKVDKGNDPSFEMDANNLALTSQVP